MLKYSKVPQEKSRLALFDNDNWEVKLMAEREGLSPIVFFKLW